MIRTALMCLFLPLVATAQDINVNDLRNSERFDLSLEFPDALHLAIAIAEDPFLFDHDSIGNSVIAQQVVRFNFLSGARSAERKLLEINLGRDLGEAFSHDEVLSLWLQSVYFGEGCTGVTNALEHMLGTSLAAADMQDFLTLLAVVKAPARYTDDRSAWADRYVFLANEGVNLGLLSAEDAEQLQAVGLSDIEDAQCPLSY